MRKSHTADAPQHVPVVIHFLAGMRVRGIQDFGRQQVFDQVKVTPGAFAMVDADARLNEEVLQRSALYPNWKSPITANAGLIFQVEGRYWPDRTNFFKNERLQAFGLLFRETYIVNSVEAAAGKVRPVLGHINRAHFIEPVPEQAGGGQQIIEHARTVIAQPRLQHQIRVPTYHVDRIELDAAQTAHNFHCPGLAVQLARRQQELMGQQETAGLGSGNGQLGRGEGRFSSHAVPKSQRIDQIISLSIAHLFYSKQKNTGILPTIGPRFKTQPAYFCRRITTATTARSPTQRSRDAMMPLPPPMDGVSRPDINTEELFARLIQARCEKRSSTGTFSSM